ncbi:MAG: RNA-binding S4 domain-containing protein [Firmicutes bacterium]|nr:RNA-binding S4 domain-containing protein [Bacillota bacterium]MDH7495867.1 RNA-binding S4 domain-containing protein [Bacillota bacterium]
MRVKITSSDIRLDQFLKWAGVASTGGQAKALVQEGRVQVNGQPELRRGRKLHPGDVVAVTSPAGASAARVEAGNGKDREPQSFEVAGDTGDGG